MISHDLNKIDHTIFKTIGISEEQFLSLPEEYQQLFLFYDWQLSNNHNLWNNFKKELLSSDFENLEVMKKKVLTLFKKK